MPPKGLSRPGRRARCVLAEPRRQASRHARRLPPVQEEGPVPRQRPAPRGHPPAGAGRHPAPAGDRPALGGRHALGGPAGGRERPHHLCHREPGGGPLAPQLRALLGLRDGQARPGALGADPSLRELRPGHPPGPPRSVLAPPGLLTPLAHLSRLEEQWSGVHSHKGSRVVGSERWLPPKTRVGTTPSSPGRRRPDGPNSVREVRRWRRPGAGSVQPRWPPGRGRACR